MCELWILLLLGFFLLLIILFWNNNSKKEKFTGCFESGFTQLPGCYKDVNNSSSFGSCSCGSQCSCQRGPAPCESKESECSFECWNGVGDCTRRDGSEGYCGLNSACYPKQIECGLNHTRV